MEPITPRSPDRATGAVLLAAAALLTGGNLAHPVDAAPSPTSRLDLAGAPAWLVVHVVIAVGFLALATGLVLLASRGRGGVAATTTAVTAIVGGGTLALVFAGLDGYGFHALAGASDDAIGAAVALDAIDTGLAGVGTLTLMGAALLSMAATLRHDPLGTHRWVVAACSLAGVLGTVSGAALLWGGATTTTINGLLRPTAMLTTLVVVGLGVALVRSAPASRNALGTSAGDAATSTRR